MKRFFRIFFLTVIFIVGVISTASAKPKLKTNSSSQGIKFSSTDLSGIKVTEEIFTKTDVTVVNVWGTFCGPCIREMPELGEWSNSMPKNVQIIGLVCDVNSPKDTDGIMMAQYICDQTGVTFTNVITNESLSLLLSGIQFVPTTFLVDKNGSIVSEMIVGADVKKYKKVVEDYLAGK